jgi:putative ABC transport system permease protein
LLAVAGTVLGVVLSAGGISVVKALPFMAVPRLDEVLIDYRVLFFALGASVITGLAFGLAPALRVSHADAASLGGRISGTPLRTGFRNVLIATEVALALVLLTGAGLLMKSLARLRDVPTGLDAHGVLTASVSLPLVSYGEKSRQTQFADELLRRLAARPEVRGVAVTTGLPFSHVSDMGTGFLESPNGMAANLYRVTPDYFRIMGIRLLRGRLLNAGDTPDSPPVLVINETMAKRAFPAGDALGKHAMVGGGTYLREIVGIVADVRQESLRRPADPQEYEPFMREPSNAFDVVIRTSTDPMAVADILRREVLALDKNLPLANVAPLQTLVNGSLARDRLSATLMGVFAVLALLLSAVGIYGVIAYAVTQRTREIGIRAALGAGRGHIVSLVLGQTARMVMLGLAFGVGVSLMLSRVLRDVLYDVAPRDPSVLVGVSLALFAVAAVAAFVPTRRAVRVSPILALRLD